MTVSQCPNAPWLNNKHYACLKLLYYHVPTTRGPTMSSKAGPPCIRFAGVVRAYLRARLCSVVLNL